MKKIAFAVAVTFASISAAQAQDWLHFEADLGGSYELAQGHGDYYQQAFPHHLKLVVPAGRVGVDVDVLNPSGFVPGVSINLSYMNFGHISIGGDAAPDQTGEFAHSGGYNNVTNKCDGECGPIRNFDTGGSLQALSLTVEPYWKSGNWRFGLEGGAALFKGTYESKMTVVSPTSPWGPKGSVEILSHIAKPQFTWVAGASVAYKSVILRYIYMPTPSRNVSDANIPLGWKAAHMLTIGYRY